MTLFLEGASPARLPKMSADFWPSVMLLVPASGTGGSVDPASTTPTDDRRVDREGSEYAQPIETQQWTKRDLCMHCG